MSQKLDKDNDIKLPDFTIISASAGSGKTHTLTLKLLQLLLSRHIPNNKLNNILAMTFTKNAAAEMRKRVLEYLKRAFLGDRKVINWLLEVVSIDEETLRERCGELIEAILKDYSSFQIQTIDSFMARVFRASALEFGFSPTLEIKPETAEILDDAFESFTRNLVNDSTKRGLLEQLTDILVEDQTSSRYIWNPFDKLSKEVRKLYNLLSSQSGKIISYKKSGDNINKLKKDILDDFHKLYVLVKDSKFEVTKHFETVIELAEKGDVDELITRKSLYNLPIKKSGEDKELVRQWEARFSKLQDEIKLVASNYIVQQAYSYYRPYVETYLMLRNEIESVMRRNGQISLTDVNRSLLEYVSEETVPQVYFYIGDSIFHYLIDEFQDTSPLQWEMMLPLLSEALSKQGGLFVVGDTKQSIYAFRNADWRIMKSIMETVVFPSAPPNVKELMINYRSYEKILNFNKHVFHEIVPNKEEGEASHSSGLSKFKQEVIKENENKGYVEVVSFEKNDDLKPERQKILEIVNDCINRRYNLSDITILTPKNEHVLAISNWLNSEKIRFISHSSLDIRRQTITNEILALLRFLDSPIDDLAFTEFLLSNIFKRVIDAEKIILTEEEIHSFLINAKLQKHPLYSIFKHQYVDLWNKYFERLFTLVGYLPMYDLLSEIYKEFRLLDHFQIEQATLIKLLEIIKDYEDKGQNNLKSFLIYAEDDNENADWNIATPHNENAVSIMTIHKAKGLDNEVIIVLLVDSKDKSDNLFIENTNNEVRLVRITKKSAEFSDSLQEMYTTRKFENTVDDLNKLYVAFTRAKKEMYIISLIDERNDKPSKYLPQAGYECSEKPDVEIKEKPIEVIANLYHSPAMRQSEVIIQDKLSFYERKRGDIIHEILSRIEFIEKNIDQNISSIIRGVIGDRLKAEEENKVKLTLLKFLQMPNLQEYFAERGDRKVLNEQEFVNEDGKLVRMDRVVIDAKKVFVIDYKTGDDKEEYNKQVIDYMNILRNCFPDREVAGVLAFIDKIKMRVIE